jgi:hypothetical protein
MEESIVRKSDLQDSKNEYVFPGSESTVKRGILQAAC